jgi:serine protease
VCSIVLFTEVFMSKPFMLPLAALLTLAACTDQTPLAAPDGAASSTSASAPSILEVKFREPLRVRGEDGALHSEAGVDLAELAALLERYGVREVTPLFQASAAHMDEIREAAVQASGQAVPDLRSWYHLALPAGVDVDEVLARLQATPEVQHAYLAPVPAPPPSQTISAPDYSPYLVHLGNAPSGIDAHRAWSLPGGAGDGVTIVDLEYDWSFEHEDLGLSESILIAGERYPGFGRDHGTAVLGVLAARHNGFGVMGGVPDATIRVASTMFPGGSYRPADAIAAATAATSPGDVLLLVQHTRRSNGSYVPLEWIQSVFDATLAATLAGRIVVAAAGNGKEDLDAPELLGRFDRSVRNSGAIIVGASAYSSRSRLTFSSYGSRVDLQGWGQAVFTTGYGDIFGSSELDFYTRVFGGTSSAAAIVAVAVAAVQGCRRAQGEQVLSAAEMVDVLRSTGTPQTGNTAEHIGPFPDLRAALLMSNGPFPPPTLSAAARTGTVARLTWSAGEGQTHYRLQRRRRTGDVWHSWKDVGTAVAADTAFSDSGRVAGFAYQYRIQGCDATLRCSGWTQSAVLAMPAIPAAPSPVLATPLSESRIWLDWVDSTTDEIGFILARREKPVGSDWGTWQEMRRPQAGATRFSDNGLTSGTMYQYRIKVCNLAGCSAWSAASTPVAPPVPPLAPSPVRVSAISATGVQVTWIDASRNETHFELSVRGHIYGNQWGAWESGGSAPANAVSLITGGVGGQFEYRVRACNGATCSSWSAAPEVTILFYLDTPGALVALPVPQRGVYLLWMDHSALDTSFNLQRQTRNPDGSYGPWQTVARPRSSIYLDFKTTAAGSYNYRVNACTATACSGWSGAANVLVP